MPVSAALKEIYLRAPADKYYVEALVLSHSAIAPIYVTNYMTKFNGMVDGAARAFVPLPFSVKLPDRDASGSQVLGIVFTNLDQQLLDDLETASRKPYEPIRCEYHVFITDVADGAGNWLPQITPPPRYDIQAVAITATEITASATKQNMHNRRWPYERYKPTTFPGLT